MKSVTMSRLDPTNTDGAVFFCPVCIEDGKLVHLFWRLRTLQLCCQVCLYTFNDEDLYKLMYASKL
jgi:hypothetical protein